MSVMCTSHPLCKDYIPALAQEKTMRLFHHMFSLMECSAPVLLARLFSILSATCYEVWV